MNAHMFDPTCSCHRGCITLLDSGTILGSGDMNVLQAHHNLCVQAKKLQDITVSWLHQLKYEVEQLVKGASNVPSLPTWHHGKSAAFRKPHVESTPPSNYLQNLFSAFPTLEEKVRIQAALSADTYPAQGDYPSSSKAIARLTKRALPANIHESMQQIFKNWVVRFLLCSSTWAAAAIVLL